MNFDLEKGTVLLGPVDVAAAIFGAYNAYQVSKGIASQLTFDDLELSVMRNYIETTEQLIAMTIDDPTIKTMSETLTRCVGDGHTDTEIFRRIAFCTVIAMFNQLR